MAGTCESVDLAAMDQTRRAVADDPGAGRGTFETTSRWQDGTRARTTARSFVIDTDEPAPLGGTDQAADPMELLLASLGTCLTIGWATQAARRGVDFRSLRIHVTGYYDLRGYRDLDLDVRPGFSRITYTVHVDTDADPILLEDIGEDAQRTSPVFDNIAQGVPITSQVDPTGALGERPGRETP